MGRVHCKNFLDSMVSQVIAKGGKIFENTLVKHVSEEKPNEVEAADGKVNFEHIVYAVHSGYTMHCEFTFKLLRISRM